MTQVTRHARCHCGAVRFSVEFPDESLRGSRCNCTICAMKGAVMVYVPQAALTVTEGGEALACYSVNSGVAKHLFCRICGIKPFYIPRSNPDGVDVNVRCLDMAPEGMRIVPFNGRDWESHAHTLAHKSRAD